ncbi:MAG TPA: protein kinase [Polyangiaceae bacterium]|nr:protein kinase [Polyangiaceae bacterium]
MSDPNPEALGRSTMPVSVPASDLIAGAIPQDPLPLEPGGVINQYEIIRELGQGGMGRVFLARDTRLARLCAMKLLLAYTGERASRFLAEARATARCKHESIVVIYEVDEIRGYPYMVLEYLEGRTLRAWMTERETPVPPRLAAELLTPVVQALVCAHDAGIVHRDLKPENILLTDGGQVKVLDFGIAKRVETGEPGPPAASVRGTEVVGWTQDGAIVGTLPYMSPEQWSGADIDFQTDLWAVGILLYELITGETPLGPATMAQLADVQHLDVPMPSAEERLPGAGALGAVIDRCLKKRKPERIGSARELLAELKEITDAPSPSSTAAGAAPFAGLSAFQEADAARFFGRDRDIAAVLGRLRNQQLVVVAGPSGAGKSSFVRAGLIPALKRSGDRWEAFVLRPGRRPLAALADVLVQVTDPTDGDRPSAPDGDADPAAILRSRPGSLGARLRARCRRAGSDHRILLFVDQFEEVYTLGADAGERAAFLSCLEGVADDPSSPLRVVLAVRSDFLDRVADNQKFTAEVTRGLVLLPPVGRDGLREALTKPALAAGYRFEDDALIKQILEALGRTRSPLPLLQFTAARLWEARDHDRKLLSRDSYRAIGGVEGALSAHADAVLASLSANEQRIARAIFLRLVTPDRTRALVSLSELRELTDDGGAAGEVAHRLADARLLHIETDGERGGGVVEIVHESLLEGWAKLRRWLDESEEDAQFLARLRAAAEQWEASGEPEGLLWRDRAAKDARGWIERRRAEEGADARAGLGKREGRYLSAVITLFERARKRQRRQIAGLIATLAVIASAVSYLAVRADREASRAQAEARQARNATRVAAARELAGDPTTALALLREVEPPEAPRGWHELTRWALQEGPARVVLTHADPLHSAAFSPDGERVVIASSGKVALVQRADGTGEPLVLRGHEERVLSAAFSPDGKRIVTASWDKTARVWSADGASEPLVLRGHENGLYSTAFSPDGKRIVTGSTDKTARVWNADGSGEPLVLRGHGSNVIWVAWSSDGERIVTASWDGMVRVWNADGTGEPLLLRNGEEGVNMAEWSPDGRRIVTASQGDLVRVWSADGTGEPLVLRGHQGEVEAATWSRDGKRIVTAADDKTARVWSADGAGEPLVLRGHQDAVSTAFFSPDGERIVTASMDKSVRIWSAGGTGRPLVLRGHQQGASSVAFSPDGRSIVTASWDKTARVWSADGTGDPLVLRHQDRVFSAAYSPDGKRIVTASPDGTARVWNIDGTGEPLVLRHPLGGIMKAAFSPDGKRIVIAGVDKTARVWSADGGGELLVLRGHSEGVNSAAFSPDGERIVTASDDGTARVWSADSGGELLVLRGHEGIVKSAAFSPDGEHIVTAGDKTARVWSANGAGEPLILRGHGIVTSAAWSPDGERIATAGDKTVRLWSADNGRELLALRGGDDAFGRVAWSPDGKRIAAASGDATVWVWTDLDPLRGLDDPRLWAATTYCMSVERRMELLDVPEATAKADQEACERRVDQARAASVGAR